MRKLSNIYWLAVKELRSFLRDAVLLVFVAYTFSLAVIMQARSFSQEPHNASIAIVDEDHSELSRRIAHAFLPPLFQTPRPIAERDIAPLMNTGRYTSSSISRQTSSATCSLGAGRSCRSTSTRQRWCRRGPDPPMRKRS